MFAEIDTDVTPSGSGQLAFYTNNVKKLKINKGLSGNAPSGVSDLEVTTVSGAKGWIDSNIRSEQVNAEQIFFYAPSEDNDGTFSPHVSKGIVQELMTTYFCTVMTK